MDTSINEQALFYSSISKYYSGIFPYKPVQLQFIINGLGDLQGKNILDIGCATGELSYQLANVGANVIGIDLNEDLLAQAKKLKSHSNARFQAGDMLNLTELFEPGYFDAIICFGNTLVHLQDIGQVREMLEGARTVLKPGGSFFLQILNYDYILGNRIEELLVIEDDSVKFIRKYIFTGGPTIRFNTQLVIKKDGQSISNETSLLALGSSDLKKVLEQAGFHSLQFYADFKENTFGGNHLPLVARCKI